MPMPTAASKSNCDASTDDPKLALLTDLATLIDKFNDLIAMRAAASGYCDLDASSLVPSARLATALAAIYGLTPAADRGLYFTSASAASLFTLTSFARTLLDDADAATARTTLGVGSASETVAGLVELATTAEAIAGTDTARAVTPAGVAASIPAQLNAAGSAPVYACRAWVNFNGTGTVTINASGNVSSITDNGTGDYTVNFTVAMPDANYAYTGTCRRADATVRPQTISQSNDAIFNPSASAFRFRTAQYEGTLQDPLMCSVAIYR